MHVLLHTCCAVCTAAPLEELKGRGHRVTAFFYNPNVHPLIEFRRRLKAQKVLAERLALDLVCEEGYGLRDWLEAVDWRAEGPARCEGCYRMRLARAAELAHRRGLDAFTSTLLISPHQHHDMVRRVGEERGAAAGVPFLYRDWRPLAEESHRQTRRMNLYHQQYCGCVFSEYERFKETTLHLYQGGTA
jgi:hypothetical protein